MLSPNEMKNGSHFRILSSGNRSKEQYLLGDFEMKGFEARRQEVHPWYFALPKFPELKTTNLGLGEPVIFFEGRFEKSRERQGLMLEALRAWEQNLSTGPERQIVLRDEGQRSRESER